MPTMSKPACWWMIGCVCFWTLPLLAASPNVVVILTDDQGWGDLSCHGNQNLSTPRIDSLAKDGATLEHFYVCHVCAPTRAEFLTGRYYPRTGVRGVSRGQGRINADEQTMGEFFHAAGYATGAFGKWHNGTQPPLHPNDRGFDEFYGFTSGHWGHYFSPPLDHNGQMVRGNGFIVDDLTDKAIAFMREHRERPFFCYVPFNTPHSPMMIADEFYDKFKDRDPVMRHRDPSKEDVMMTRAALAMCENIDWNVGRLLDALHELGLDQNTIVVFFCDNGPNSFRWNGGMKGRKGSIDEGGVRSPCFVRWPRRIEAGRRIPHIAGAIDLLPTLADLIDVPLAMNMPIDGRSLKPLLCQDNAPWAPRLLFSSKTNQVSVRSQRFRLDPTGKLFDMTSDIGQHVNVATRFPNHAARLRKAASEHARAMQVYDLSEQRPFHVGYGNVTRLPARDGTPHGSIQRSSKAPNNSFFTNWSRQDDFISWPIDVGTSGSYRVLVHYTCAKTSVGTVLELACGETSIRKQVTQSFDPPLYEKPFERVANSHYFVKDFRPLELGTLQLEAGVSELRLQAMKIVGAQAIDLHSLELRLQAKRSTP